jgi:hypothetical protein
MTHEVFISYSSKDQKIVEGLSAYLEQHGIRCFVAYRDIPKGVVWAAAITEAIENCQCMVVVFSGNFNSSPQVDREIEMCAEEKKTIIPFKIQDAPLVGAKKYYLKNINWIDAFPEPENYFGDLCNAVKKLLPNTERTPVEIKSPPPPPTTSAQCLLKIRPNCACKIFVDEELKTVAEADRMTKLPLNKGAYFLEFVSVENESDKFTVETYTLADAEQLLIVDLESIRQKRIEKLELIVFTENGKYGFKEKETGKEIIPLKYDLAYKFQNIEDLGLACVESNSKYGFIDKTGKEITPLKYDYAFGFCGGLAKVELNGEIFYIDKQGKRV